MFDEVHRSAIWYDGSISWGKSHRKSKTTSTIRTFLKKGLINVLKYYPNSHYISQLNADKV
jgi:hypothetical protein